MPNNRHIKLIGLFLTIHYLLLSRFIVSTDEGECAHDDDDGVEGCHEDSIDTGSVTLAQLKSRRFKDNFNDQVTMTALENTVFLSSQQPGTTFNIIPELSSGGLEVVEKIGNCLLKNKTKVQSVVKRSTAEDSTKSMTEIFEMWTQSDDQNLPRTWKTLVICAREVGLEHFADDIESYFPNTEEMFVVADALPPSCAECHCWCVPSLWRNKNDRRFTRVCVLLQRLRQLVDNVSKSDIKNAEVRLMKITTNLNEFVTRLLDQTVRVGIVGLTKAGKSTFLNALLGRSFLPSSIQPQTSNVVTIFNDISSPNGELHCILNGVKSRTAFGHENISQKLLEYNQEQRLNGTIDQKCNQLVLHAPLKFLHEMEDVKLNLSDTPGFGEAGGVKLDTIALQKLSAFILILNSDNMKSDSELFLLKKLTEYHPELFSQLNRVLILVNCRESVYSEKKVGFASASVPPEKISDYISNYFESLLNIKIAPNNIILFNALWALRSREWRKESILNRNRKKAKILFTEALQMFRYIDKEDIADEFEGNITEDNIQNVTSLLESFSNIETIERHLRKKVVETGGLILLEGAVDNTVSVIKNDLVPAINELIKYEWVEIKETELQSTKEIEELLEGMIFDGKTIFGKDLHFKLNHSSQTKIFNHLERLKRILFDTISTKLEDRLEKVKNITHKVNVVRKMDEARDSISNSAVDKMKIEWLTLSLNTMVDHLVQNTFLDMKSPFLAGIMKIRRGESNSELFKLVEDLSGDIPALLSNASVSVDPAPGCSLAIDKLALSGKILREKTVFSCIKKYEIEMNVTELHRNCTSGYIWGETCVRVNVTVLRNVTHYSPDIQAFANAFNDAVQSWVDVYNEQVENCQADLLAFSRDSGMKKLESILEEPLQRVNKQFQILLKSLKEAQQNVSFLKKATEDMWGLRRALKNSI